MWIFHENDREDRTDHTVVELSVRAVITFGFPESNILADPFILAQQKVGVIAGCTLSWEVVSDLLHLDVYDAPVSDFDYDVHYDQGVVRCKVRFVWKDAEILNILSEHDRDQPGEGPFAGVRVEHVLEKGVVKDLNALIAAADIEKILLILRLEAKEFFFKLWDGRNLPAHLLGGPVLRELFPQGDAVRLPYLSIFV